MTAFKCCYLLCSLATLGASNRLLAQNKPYDLPSSTEASPEEPSLRALVDQFYATYAKKDLDGFMALWSRKSPDYGARQQQMQQFFAANDKIEAKNLNIQRVSVEGGKASLRVTVEMTAVEAKTGKPASEVGKLIRDIDVVKEEGAWKVWRDVDAVEDLAARLVAAGTEEDRNVLLAREKELVTPELARAMVKQGEMSRMGGDYTKALSVYRQAQDIAEQIGDRAGIAMALRGIGAVDALQGNYGQAMEDYEKSLTLAHEADDKSLIASILSNIGIVHAKQGKYAEASKYYENSLRLAEAVGDKPLIASLLSNIAMIHLAQGDNARALEYLQKSLTLAEDAGDKERTAASLSNLGVVYRGQADYARALDCYQRSVTIAQELGKKEQVALGLNNMGTVYQLRGNYARALDYYEKSLAMCEELGAKERVIVALYNIGELHRLQGNYAQALEHYQRALKMSEALDDQGKTATLLNSLGTLYQEQGKYTQALEFCVRGLTLAETSGDKSEISFALDAVGQVHRWQGNYSRALEYFQKSLTMREALGDRQGIAETLQNIGEVYAAQRDYTRALESAERAAGVAREIGLREVVWEASTTAGKAYRGLGEPTSAYKTFEEAIAAIETLRTQVAGGEEEQQRFFENKLVPYRQVIELLVTENRPGDALSYAERAKGRVLLDVLRSGRINVTKAMTTTEQGQEQAFRDQLVSLNGQISRENEVPKPDAKRLADLKTRLDKARLDYDAFQTSLYAAHPELKSQRGEVQPVTVDEAADLLPGVESALLEYEVTEDKTYLFVLTRSAGSGTDLRAYPLGIQPKDLAKKTEQFRQQLAQRDLSFRASAAALYETLLAPAQQQLRGKTALVIVPDGALWELPFQALQSSSNRYLLENCAIAYAPSLTVLREMVRLRRRNAQTASKTEALLAMGNPALGKLTTDRVQMAYRDEKLAPLPDAEREVRGLGQVYGAGHSKVYVGGEASEERFKAEAGVYQVIHLATHGFFNNTSPMYSHVVLSQAGNNDKEDGLLEAWEIMQMDLKADLAVLSACETGRGRAGAGEGLIGLTWALFVAGVPTTVVSQWKVESASTTELMLEFHRRLKSGIKASPATFPSAQALRQAALKLLHSDQYAHPFYWAPFVVVGNGF